jgi:S-adenosylmethionine-diacylgycerolhomoserine-N-methlytransferase
MGKASANRPSDHAELMDGIYRGQRHIYDLTRKYYLFGRDRLIAGLDVLPGEAVLEIACGTGRNLAKVGARYPGAPLYGVDISREMLRSAEAALGDRARLAVADACRFDAGAVLGRSRFDRVMLSYCLSMIPDWVGALDQAAALVAPGGSLHIVDFGDLAGLARPLAGALRGWLGKFHVEPRTGLAAAAERVAASHGLTLSRRDAPLNYYQSVTLRCPG